MRYWVYKDAQILGPIEGKEFIHRKDLSDALVCPEGAAGVQESDWRSAEELFKSSEPAAPVAQADEPSETGAKMVSEEWSDYVRGAPPVGGGEEGALGGMFHFAPTCEIQSKTARRQISELQEKLGDLTRKIEQYEDRQNMLLERLNEKDHLLDEKKKFIDVLQSELQQKEEKQQAPVPVVPASWTIEGGLKPVSLGLRETAAEPQRPVEQAPKTVPIPPAKPSSTPTPAEITKPIKIESVSEAASGGAPAVQTMPVFLPTPSVTPEILTAPIEPVVPSPVNLKHFTEETPKPQSFSPPPPEPVKAGWPQRGPEAIAAAEINIKPPQEQPPAKSLGPFETPLKNIQPQPAPSTTGAGLEPVHLDIEDKVKKEAATWPPPSRVPEAVLPTRDTFGRSEPQSANVPPLNPSGLTTTRRPFGRAPFEGVPAASLESPKPKPAATRINAPPAPKKTWKVSPWAIWVAGIVVVGVLIFSLSSGSKKGGNSSPEAPTSSEPSAIGSSQPSTAPQNQSGRDYIADLSPKAIQLVKDFPLSRGRQTVSKWLQYSFLSVPGNDDEWVAGAQSADSYIVQYRVYRGGRSADRAPIAYTFEADLAKNSVQGLNQAAKELLADEEKKPAKAAHTVHKSRTKQSKPKKKPAKQKKHGVAQVPLPGF